MSNRSWGRNNESMPRFLMPPHPLSNSQLQRYYQKETRLILFIKEIIYVKKGWSICNEYRRVKANNNSLDSSVSKW